MHHMYTRVVRLNLQHGLFLNITLNVCVQETDFVTVFSTHPLRNIDQTRFVNIMSC